MFSQRHLEPELLDHLPPEEARPNLADLTRINRRFGGHSVIRKTLAKMVDVKETFTVLDIGAASGDTAVLIRKLYPRASVLSLDYNATNIEAAPQPKLIANAFNLPFRAGSFDFVVNSLFLHHFTNEQVAELLGNFYQLARRALLVFDLERHFVPYLFLTATKPLLGWGDVTVHDGRISVRAAFRAQELARLARQAGIGNVEVKVYRPAFRIALTAARNSL